MNHDKCASCKVEFDWSEERPSYCPNCKKPFIIKPKIENSIGEIKIRNYSMNKEGNIEDSEVSIKPIDKNV